MRAWLIIGLLAVSPFRVQNPPSQEHQQQTKEAPRPLPPAPIATTPTGQPTPTPEQNSAHDKGADSLSNRLLDPLIANWPLVAVGIVGIWVTLRTLGIIRLQTKAAEDAANAARDTAIIMNDTAQRQLRAYVLVSSALLKFKEPGVPEVQVHFKNFGQTPAYDFHGWIGMYIGDYPLAEKLPPDANLLMGSEPLPPGRVSIHVISRDPPVQPQFVPFLGTPKGTIYVFGEMVYRDTFGNKRYMRYRLMHGGREGVQPMKNADGVVTGYLLKADMEGNEAD